MNNSAAVGKFVVCQIADSLLALPIANVLKVINCPPPETGDTNNTGLIHLGRHTVTLLDLHQRLAHSCPQRHSPFLLIVQSATELWAIPVDEPPNLVELSRDSIRALPQSYHHHGWQDIVSYVAAISEAEKTLTIFLLDVNRAVSHADNRSIPRLITVES